MKNATLIENQVPINDELVTLAQALPLQ